MSWKLHTKDSNTQPPVEGHEACATRQEAIERAYDRMKLTRLEVLYIKARKGSASNPRKLQPNAKRVVSPDLPALASILADWIEPAPTVPAIYLFGSRVRGDHRPDSDIDVRLFLDEWKHSDDATIRWWVQQNETDFAVLKSRLPGPLAIHREKTDEADRAIWEGRKNPVLVVGRAVCVWTPPRRIPVA